MRSAARTWVKKADEFAPRNLGRLDLKRPAGVSIRSDQSLYFDSLQRTQQRHELIGARLLGGRRQTGDGPHQLRESQSPQRKTTDLDRLVQRRLRIQAFERQLGEAAVLETGHADRADAERLLRRRQSDLHPAQLEAADANSVIDSRGHLKDGQRPLRVQGLTGAW